MKKGILSSYPNFMFICTNKTTGSKFYSGDNLKVPSAGNNFNFKNPEAGTVVDKEITSGRDFYLISQKTL